MTFRNITTDTQKVYTIEDGGIFVYFFQNRSGKIQFDIKHSKAQVFIYGFTIGKGDEKYTIETHQNHLVHGAQSELLLKNILYDSAQIRFNGTITIEKNAKKSNASLTNNNLLLGKQAFVDTQPNLNIKTHDVSCSHAATTSQLHEDQFLYCNLRGLDSNEAENLLVQGFIDDIYTKIKQHGLSTTELDIIKKD